MVNWLRNWCTLSTFWVPGCMDHELLLKHVNLRFFVAFVVLCHWEKKKCVFPAIAMHMKKSSWDRKYEMTYQLINLLDPTTLGTTSLSAIGRNKSILIHKSHLFTFMHTANLLWFISAPHIPTVKWALEMKAVIIFTLSPNFWLLQSCLGIYPKTQNSHVKQQSLQTYVWKNHLSRFGRCSACVTLYLRSRFIDNKIQPIIFYSYCQASIITFTVHVIFWSNVCLSETTINSRVYCVAHSTQHVWHDLTWESPHNHIQQTIFENFWPFLILPHWGILHKMDCVVECQTSQPSKNAV